MLIKSELRLSLGQSRLSAPHSHSLVTFHTESRCGTCDARAWHTLSHIFSEAWPEFPQHALHQYPFCGAWCMPVRLSGIAQFCTHVCHVELLILSCFLPLAMSFDLRMTMMLWMAPTHTPV